MGVIATMTLRKTRKLHHEVHASTFRHSLKTIMYASVCVFVLCVPHVLGCSIVSCMLNMYVLFVHVVCSSACVLVIYVWN